MKPNSLDEFGFYHDLAKAAMKLCKEDELEIGDAVRIICQLHSGNEEESQVFQDIIYDYYGDKLERQCK